MKNAIKIGDRVNVDLILSESWYSRASMTNGRVVGIEDSRSDILTFYHIVYDNGISGKIEFTRQLYCGHFSNTAYKITKVNEEKNNKIKEFSDWLSDSAFNFDNDFLNVNKSKINDLLLDSDIENI